MKLLPRIVVRNYFLAVLVMSLAMSSCIKERINTDKISDAVDWPVAYGMPLAYGNLTLGDIVSGVDSKAFVKEDKDGLLYLLYRDHVFSQTAENLLTIPPQSYSQTFRTLDKDFPVNVAFDSIHITRDTTFAFLFNKTDVEIDSITFKSGILNFASNSGFPYNNRIDITFPTFTKNGRPLQVSFKNNSATSPVSINGYKLQFAKKGTSVNLIPVHYYITIFNGKSPISSSQSLTSTVDFSSAGFSSLFGYLGQIPDLLSLANQKLTLDFFGGSDTYNVEINNPTINLYIKNSFGIPIQVQVSNVKTYSDKTSSFFPITFAPSTFLVKSPNLSQVGKSEYDTIHVTSNFLNAIPTSPHYFYYSEVATTNPAGKTGVNSNFFTDSSKINVDLELKLPFDLKASNLATTDTVEFDLGKTVSDFSIIKKLAIYNTFTNSIPFDLRMQVFLADANKVIIDSLYRINQQPLVKSGVNDGTGKYVPSSATTLEVTFDEARAKKLEKVKYAFIKVGMTTAGGGSTFVKFYSGYRLNCAFQVQAELHVTSLSQF